MDATLIRTEINVERVEEPHVNVAALDIKPLDPPIVRIEAEFYVDGKVMTIEAAGPLNVIQSMRSANTLDELLAADMREVWQRDYQRRQEAAAGDS